MAALDKVIADAEANILAAEAGAVPPHKDFGGSLPFGGTTQNGTHGPSAFGKRKIVNQLASVNPQALMLNYPPQSDTNSLKCWERNYKSSIFLDPSAELEAERCVSIAQQSYGASEKPSHLASQHRTYGDVRRTNCTRPSPSPPIQPDDIDGLSLNPSTELGWKWPEKPARAAAPKIERPAKVEQGFMEEYTRRPPWLKY